MFIILINIVLPVFFLVAIGFVFGQLERKKSDMAFINKANVMVFCPALVFSALLGNPISLSNAWPLIVAGILIVIIPGLLLYLVAPPSDISRLAFLVPSMFRNTGNIGIPLMLLAYGENFLGDIIILFVLSNLLQFSLGVFLFSRNTSCWMWLRNPNIWAAILGVALASYSQWIPSFIKTSADLAGQVAVPLMLFGLGVRMSQDRIIKLALALKINGLYMLAGMLTIPIVFVLLPLTPEWARLVALAAMLPPAVLNYLLSEQYNVEPETIASVVLSGNILSVITIPLTVWVTLSWL